MGRIWGEPRATWVVNGGCELEYARRFFCFKGDASRGKVILKEGEVNSLEFGDELKDLLKMYVEAEEGLKRKEAVAQATVVAQMKRFIDLSEERKRATAKLERLKMLMKLQEGGRKMPGGDAHVG